MKIIMLIVDDEEEDDDGHLCHIIANYLIRDIFPAERALIWTMLMMKLMEIILLIRHHSLRYEFDVWFDYRKRNEKKRVE